jgi:hypothetical protein
VSEAEEKFIDINVIYDRGFNDFFKRVRRQMENYQLKINDMEKEFNKLKKSKRKSLKQEERMIELDSMLERSIDKRSEFPKTLKQTADLEKLKELIEETEKLINEIKKHDKPHKTIKRK